MKITSLAKIALAIGMMVILAVLSILVQQLLFGKINVVVTSAVISTSAFSIWRLLWKPAK
ncbi:MAG: hypothetical protein AAB354_00680 [candidate division KSB1 bacterium]